VASFAAFASLEPSSVDAWSDLGPFVVGSVVVASSGVASSVVAPSATSFVVVALVTVALVAALASVGQLCFLLLPSTRHHHGQNDRMIQNGIFLPSNHGKFQS